MTSQIARAADALYDSTGEPDDLPDALQAALDAMNARMGLLLVRPGSYADPPSFVLPLNFDPDALIRYQQRYAALDLWSREADRLQFPAGATTIGERLVDPEVLRRSEIYADMIRPLDNPHLMGGVAEKGAERLVQFSVFRGAARNAFEPAEERAMTALLPAIRLATRVALQVGALKREAAVLSDTLDARPERIVLVDARGAVVAVNTSAQALLAGDGPLRIVRRRLTGRRQQETAAIAGLLSAAATPGADPASVILRGSDGAAALRLSAVPLAEAARVRRGGQPSEAPAAAVFLDVPGATGRVCPSTAMALYGLTRTQARLAAALANGATLQQTAGDLGIAPGTARTHLKAVFQKTGTRRQPDLVALLLSDASALP